MNLVEDVRKTVGNPKPLYFAAGVGDAAVAALKDAPALLTDVSAKATEAAGKVAATVAGAAETVQSKIALGQLSQLSQLDPRGLRDKFSEPDLRAVREKTQNLALAQVGRALEIAGKAVETYDGYAERGKVVVDRVLSGFGGTEVQVVTVDKAAKPAAEQRETVVVVEEVEVVAEAAPQAEAKVEPKVEAKPAAKPEPKAEAPAAAAAKKPAATPRRNATPRNATPRKKANDTTK